MNIFTNDNTEFTDLMISKYAILDNNYVEGDVINYNSINENKINGTLLYDNNTENFKFNKFTVRVFFEWYEGETEKMNDENDTNLQSKFNSFNINANIHFSQKLN